MNPLSFKPDIDIPPNICPQIVKSFINDSNEYVFECDDKLVTIDNNTAYANLSRIIMQEIIVVFKSITTGSITSKCDNNIFTVQISHITFTIKQINNTIVVTCV